MKLDIVLKETILFCIILFFVMSPVHAETVRPLNPDCEECPVVISYSSEETRTILGNEGQALLMDLETVFPKKSLKIDIDGKKEPGTEESTDNDYELLVFFYPRIIVMTSTQDSSSIKLNTDYATLKQKKGKWNPELELMATEEHEITSRDTLPIAWIKISNSRIYEYINRNKDEKNWNENLQGFVLNILKIGIHQ